MRRMEFKMERPNLVKKETRSPLLKVFCQVLIITQLIRQLRCPETIYSGSGCSRGQALCRK